MVRLPTPIHEISHKSLKEKGIKLFVKRDDMIHPYIMGNKWRKLKFNLAAIKKNKLSKIVTMGGAFSNHIAATAALAHENNLDALGIIRGEELNETSNHTLELAKKNGMKLNFIDRSTFRLWRNDPAILKQKYPGYYFLPEGGTNKLAIKGCEEIIPEIDFDFDVMVTPIGTGGTFAGLLNSARENQKIIGISSLKGSFIHNEIDYLLETYRIKRGNYQIIEDYHFGGYGKATPELIDFINWFKENFDIPLDPIYTGKSFFAVWDMIKSNKFENNLKIVILHTGGLQGIEGFNRKNEKIIQ